MSSTLKDGIYKPLSAFQKVNGLWVPISLWNKYQGVWYEVNTNGIKVVIDSPTPIYDFNLKNFLISAGLWTPEKPIVINELLITEQTVLTQEVSPNVPPEWNRTAPGLTWGEIPFPTKGYEFGGYQEILQNPGSYAPPGVGERGSRVYIHQNLSLHAFDTGDGWPPRSRIGLLKIKGKVYGKGGSGSGSRNSGTIFPALYVSVITALYYGHGWPALRTTIPIKFLDVDSEGLIAGGGGGCPNFPPLKKRAFNLSLENPVHPADLEKNADGSFPVEPVPPNAGQVFHRNPLAAHNFCSDSRYNFLSEGYDGGNGGGGGQGNGEGGPVHGKLPLNVVHQAPQPGGSGTLSSVGFTPQNPVRCANIPEAMLSISGGVDYFNARAGAWGEDGVTPTITDYFSRANTATPALQRGPIKDPLAGQIDVDRAPGASPKVLVSYEPAHTSKGGNSISGVSLIQTILGEERVKGRRV